jgi:oxygen-independent coproporphyrinogen-3 oxidase
VYVHFPYCASKCPYCDFNSHVLDHEDDRYARAILAELEARANDLPPPTPGRRALSSVFFGGGTPSRWAPEAVGRVLDGIRARTGAGPNVEVTLEANPGSADAARFEAFVAAGVGRLSIGCQSFDDDELTWLGRRHDAATGTRAVEAAVRAGARVSLDVMYGLPGQSWAAIRRTLDRAIALGTEHISAYALTVEPGTLLERRASLKLFRPVDDDRMAELYERVTGYLADRGFERYEVSNYARPGAECRHNVLYWQGGAYLGLGAGAHGYRPGRGAETSERRENVRAPRAYLEAVERGDFAPRVSETLDALQRVRDRFLVAFRTRWGLDLDELELSTRSRARLEPAWIAARDGLAAAGLLEDVGPRWRPTDRGFAFADTIARAFVAADESQ